MIVLSSLGAGRYDPPADDAESLSHDSTIGDRAGIPVTCGLRYVRNRIVTDPLAWWCMKY